MTLQYGLTGSYGGRALMEIMGMQLPGSSFVKAPGSVSSFVRRWSGPGSGLGSTSRASSAKPEDMGRELGARGDLASTAATA